jgi:hypothetical protein
MCSNFIEDFTNKIAEKCISCDACKMKRKICKIPDSNFNYIDKRLYQIIPRNVGRDEVWLILGDLSVDVLISCLHDTNYQVFLKLFANLHDTVYNGELLTSKIREHFDCFEDKMYVCINEDSYWGWSDIGNIKLKKETQKDRGDITFKEWLRIFFLQCV